MSGSPALGLGPNPAAFRSYITRVERAYPGRYAGYGWKSGSTGGDSAVLVLYFTGNEPAPLALRDAPFPVEINLGAPATSSDVLARATSAYPLFQQVLRTPWSQAYDPATQALVVRVFVPEARERDRILQDCHELSAAVGTPVRIAFEEYPLPQVR